MRGTHGFSKGGAHRGRGRRGGKGRQCGNFMDFEDDEDFDDMEAVNLEDECDTSDDEGADDELVLPVALPVCGGPMPPSDEPPKDADEYLRQVQWERMHLSETVDVEVVEKPARRRKQNKGVSMLPRFEAPEIPQELQHCSEWAEDVVAAFRDLRARCEKLKEAVGGEEQNAAEMTAAIWHEQYAQSRPSTAALAALDVVTIHRLVAVVIDAIVDAQEAASSTVDSHSANDGATAGDTSNAAVAVFGPESLLADWAFAILAFVEEPLVDDIQFNLQRLRRTCQKTIVSAHAQAEAGAKVFDRTAHAQATLLLVICAEYFGQR